MSRDWTPKEWEAIHNKMPDLFESTLNMTVTYDGETKPVYSEQELKDFAVFPKLARIGSDFLRLCEDVGLLSSTEGRYLVKAVEKTLNGEDSGLGKEFNNTVNLWYEGKLEPGHYLEDNNRALVEELLKQLKDFPL